MKYFILFLISINSFAGGFLPIEKPNFDRSQYGRLYEFKDECEKEEGFSCHDIDKCPLEICSLVDGPKVFDRYIKEGEQLCQDQVDCDLKLQSIVCSNGDAIKNLDSMSVYCAVATYKDGPKILVIDDVKESLEKTRNETKRIARESKRLAKNNAKNDLDSIDLSGSKTNAELKQIIKKIIEAIQDE